MCFRQSCRHGEDCQLKERKQYFSEKRREKGRKKEQLCGKEKLEEKLSKYLGRARGKGKGKEDSCNRFF